MKRQPGQRATSSEIIRSATLWALALILGGGVLVASLGYMLAGTTTAKSIALGAALAAIPVVITWGLLAVAKNFSRGIAVTLLLGYILKLVVLLGAFVIFRDQDGVNLVTMLAAFLVSVIGTLGVYTVGVLRAEGPEIGAE